MTLNLKDAIADTTVEEGLYLYEHGIDPYDGGVCHQAPLLLALLAVLQYLPFVQLATAILFSMVDLLSCLCLLEIAASPYVLQSMESKRLRPWILAAM